MTESVAAIAQWPLLIEDSGSISAKEIGAIARLFISQGAQIIFVDYLQRVPLLARANSLNWRGKASHRQFPAQVFSWSY